MGRPHHRGLAAVDQPSLIIMLVVGLTGGIASGKTTIERWFRAQGVAVIDADRIARELVQPGQAGLRQVVDAFGTDILDPGGQLDRARMRTLIFTDPAARHRLEGILHPLVAERMRQQLARLNTPYTVLSVPLLLESGQDSMVDRILVVDLPEALQIERLMARDQCDHSAALAILKAQMDRQQRLDAADDIIDNSGTERDLAAQLSRLHQQYLAIAAAPGSLSENG